MSGFRKPEIPRHQLTLWSQRLDDAVPADHPVRHVDLLLRSAVFAPLFQEWERDYDLMDGQPPYHPRDLAALYIYGMMNRVRSSRQLEAACWNRLDIAWLMSGQKPDHATIAAFVSRNAARLKGLKKKTLEVGIRCGLVKLDHVSVDGTAMEADAGRGSIHSKESIERQVARLDEMIAACEAEWEANEKKETSLFGAEAPWSPSRTGSAAQRLQRLERTQAKLKDALAAIARREQEAAQAGCAAPKAIAATTDADSRVMPDKEGRRKPNYNAQVAVDAGSGMIVAEQVSDRAEDSGQLTPMLEQVKENCGRLPAEASADSQYNTGHELAKLEEMGVRGLLPEVHTRDGCKTDRGLDDAQAQAQHDALAAAQRGESLSDEQIRALPRDGRGRSSRGAQACPSHGAQSEPQSPARGAAAQGSPSHDAQACPSHAAQGSSSRGAQACPSHGAQKNSASKSQGRISRAAFVYDPAKDEYRCPAGRSLPLLRTSTEPSRGGPYERRQYRCNDCASCPHAAICCANPQRGRTVNRDEFEDHRQRMRAHMKEPAAQDRYRLRKQTVEPRIGYIKHGLGVRRFLRRGLAGVSTEWTLICAAVNFGVLLRCWELVKPALDSSWETVKNAL